MGWALGDTIQPITKTPRDARLGSLGEDVQDDSGSQPLQTPSTSSHTLSGAEAALSNYIEKVTDARAPVRHGPPAVCDKSKVTLLMLKFSSVTLRWMSLSDHTRRNPKLSRSFPRKNNNKSQL